MVMTYPLTLVQWGREDTTTKGTGVAATKKMVVESMTWQEQDAVTRPRIARGLMLDNPGNELVTMRGTTWTAAGPFAFDEFHRWLEMAIKQCVTPTGTNPYTWVYAHDPTANNQIASYTLERSLTEGSNTIGQEINYATLQTLTVRGAANSPIAYEASGFARRIQTASITGALSHPTIEIPPFAASKVYIDTSWAGLGGTQLTGTNGVLSWEFTIRTGATALMGAEARSDLDFSHVERDGRNIGIDIRARVLLDTSSGQYATEKTAAEAQSLRAVRIQFSGTSSRDFKLDALVKHRAGSLIQVDEQDGFGVFDLDLVSATDATNAFTATLVNTSNETP